MSQIIITVSDTDLDAGTFKVDLVAQGTEIDDGQATAAYFTAFYLNSIVNTPDFTAGVIAFGKDVINGMTRDNPNRPQSAQPASMILTLTDQDLDTGRYSTTIESKGGDVAGESLPTTAQIVGAYMRYLLTDMAFRDKVWAFADEFVANHEGTVIANDDMRASEVA